MTPPNIQKTCRAQASSAAEYGIPFTKEFLEIVHTDGRDEIITLRDGSRFALTPKRKVLGLLWTREAAPLLPRRLRNTPLLAFGSDTESGSVAAGDPSMCG